MIRIDASQVAGGLDHQNFFAEYYDGMGGGSFTFHGGEPDIFFGQPQYVSGPQVSFSYNEDGSPSDKVTLIEGDNLAYDWIHYGPSYPHAISGNVDKVTFGVADEGTTTEDGDEHGVMSGLDGLVISGLGYVAAPGLGNVPENLTFALYNAVSAAGTDADYIAQLYSMFAAEEQLFYGSRGGDDFTAGAFADRLRGKSGDDVLDGGDGDDRMAGQNGDDQLFGSDGDDVLQGGGGADTLDGGAGRDKLAGGSGADVFVFGTGANDAQDLIVDFGTGDTIDLSAFAATFADVAIDERGRGSLVTVELGADDLVFAVRGASLAQADFVF